MSGYALGQTYGYGLTQQSVITPAVPAAGASFSQALGGTAFPGGYRWRLVGITWKLSTDANAANRYTTVEYLDGDGVAFMADGAGTVATANTTNQRFIGSLRHGPSDFAANTDVFFPLSGLWLGSGHTIKINVANIQVGDTLTVIKLTFDRLPTDPHYKPWMSDE